MFRKHLTSFPWYFFLIPLYPIITLHVKNFSRLSFSSVLRSYLIVFSISIILTVIYFLIKKENIKKIYAGVFLFILLVFFFYGWIYEYLEKLYFSGFWPFRNIHRYLIISSLLFIGWGIRFLKRKTNSIHKLFSFFNFFFLTLISLNLIHLFIIQIKKPSNTTPFISKKNLLHKNLPDIIHIVLDGYASDDVLKKNYGYNNDWFKKSLKETGFTDYPGIVTYYYSTRPSLTSILNLNFIDDSIAFNKAEKLQNNELFRTLLSCGYRINYYESGYEVTSYFPLGKKINTGSINEFERNILRLSVFRFDEFFGIISYHRIINTIQQLDHLEKYTTSDPDYFFVHMVCPHPPYVLDSSLHQKTKFINQDNFWEPRSDFKEQTHALNQLILPKLKKLSRIENTLIVLHSDHGPYILHSNLDSIMYCRENILCSIRWPDHVPPDSLYHATNIFRLIVKEYIDSTISLLPPIPKDKEKFRLKYVLPHKLIK